MKHSWHILVVDDDPQIGDLLKDYLEQHGYRVSMAQNGHEMRKIMNKTKVDLVVLDVMLPGEDGLTLCRKLREESSDFLTAICKVFGFINVIICESGSGFFEIETCKPLDCNCLIWLGKIRNGKAFASRTVRITSRVKCLGVTRR